MWECSWNKVISSYWQILPKTDKRTWCKTCSTVAAVECLAFTLAKCQCVCLPQSGNTFVLELAFKDPCSIQRWAHVIALIKTCFLCFYFLIIFVLGAGLTDKLSPLLTGFSSWLLPSSHCILSTCCWRRPMKEVSLSDSRQYKLPSGFLKYY